MALSMFGLRALRACSAAALCPWLCSACVARCRRIGLRSSPISATVASGSGNNTSLTRTSGCVGSQRECFSRLVLHLLVAAFLWIACVLRCIPGVGLCQAVQVSELRQAVRKRVRAGGALLDVWEVDGSA